MSRKSGYSARILVDPKRILSIILAAKADMFNPAEREGLKLKLINKP
jgi:hypothetical protein